MTRANANPLSRGSGLARRSSWCRRPARSRGLKKRAFGRGARHLATTKSNAARTCRVEDAGLVRNARARTVWCPSRVRARSLGPRVRARRVECGASAAPSSFPPHPAVLKKRTESEKYLVPSATDCKVCTLFQKRARSIRSTRHLGSRENLRILRLAFCVLIGRPTECIDGAFTVSVKFTDRPDFNDVLRSDPGSRQLTISTCVRHVAKASNVRVLQRTCERRTTAQAASSSPTWEVDQIGSRRVSRDESSAEVWEFSGGPERKFRRSAVWLREATLRSGCRHARRPSSSSTPSKGAREALRRCPRAWTTTTRCSGWFSRPGASRAT